MTIEGGCLCGAVRYAISGEFQVVGNCHCSMCRKSNGAAYVTWGLFDPAQFKWTAGEDFVGSHRSSANVERRFCTKCGSSLASAHDGHISEVTLGTVDGDPGARPREHIFVGSKAPWHEITDSLPQHQEWPPGFGGN